MSLAAFERVLPILLLGFAALSGVVSRQPLRVIRVIRVTAPDSIDCGALVFHGHGRGCFGIEEFSCKFDVGAR